MIADFPYLQQSQVLLTKALFNEKHYEFEKQLRNTALMVPDREVLFQYIYQIVPEEVQPAAQTITPIVGIIEESAAPETIEEIVQVQEQETPIIEENRIESTVESIEENQLLNAAEELIKEAESDEKSKLNTTQELSFFEWLKQSDKLKQTIEEAPLNNTVTKETEPQVTPVAKEEEAIKEETTSIETSTEQPEVKPSSNIHSFENILDKFIKENPSISRPKAEFYNPVNVAKNSAEEDDDLVTETLASIYYKQGYYKKAIRAYEKLCLIYPHKMAYFASLIQKIKTENKD